MRAVRQYSHPYATFAKAARRFKPSELLPALARISVALQDRPNLQLWRRLPPWGVAAAARESLLHGNEHMQSSVSPEALRKLINSFNDVYDPQLSNDGPLAILTRVAFEQFAYQERDADTIARTHVLLAEGVDEVGGLRVINTSAIEDVLGCGLRDAIGATFGLHVGAVKHGGFVEPTWFDQPNFGPVLAEVPREAFEDEEEEVLVCEQSVAIRGGDVEVAIELWRKFVPAMREGGRRGSSLSARLGTPPSRLAPSSCLDLSPRPAAAP